MDLFINQIYALVETLPLATIAIEQARVTARQQLHEFFKKEGKEIQTETGPRYTFDSGLYWKAQRYSRRVKKADLARVLVPRSLIVALVSQFDAFEGRLIKQLFRLKTEILDCSGSTLTFAQLNEFGSIEAAREYVIDKEIETVLRKSHSEQFDWLESKFGLPLRTALPSWAAFIEVTERRNLFVHTNGIVSRQYLEVCRKNGLAAPPNLRVGDSLPVTLKYFETAYECIFEIGAKLAQVLWRKLQPSEIENADSSLAKITYELLVEGRMQLAQILLDFATDTLKKHSSEEHRLRYVINRAQTYKWMGNNAKCLSILDAEDWSATSLKFKLGNAVLRNDFKQANEIVKQLGNDQELDKHAYRDWPLFKEFRSCSEFVALFEQLFGEQLNAITMNEEETVGAPPNLPN